MRPPQTDPGGTIKKETCRQGASWVERGPVEALGRVPLSDARTIATLKFKNRTCDGIRLQMGKKKLHYHRSMYR